MTEQRPIPGDGCWTNDNWQQLGDVARRLVEEKARQRGNAPDHERQPKENGDD